MADLETVFALQNISANIAALAGENPSGDSIIQVLGDIADSLKRLVDEAAEVSRALREIKEFMP